MLLSCRMVSSWQRFGRSAFHRNVCIYHSTQRDVLENRRFSLHRCPYLKCPVLDLFSACVRACVRVYIYVCVCIYIYIYRACVVFAEPNELWLLTRTAGRNYRFTLQSLGFVLLSRFKTLAQNAKIRFFFKSWYRHHSHSLQHTTEN